MFLNKDAACKVMTDIVNKALTEVVEAPGRNYQDLSRTQIGDLLLEKVEELLKADNLRRHCSVWYPMVVSFKGSVLVSFCFLALYTDGDCSHFTVQATHGY